MCQKIKTTLFFIWPASWKADISSFYYSDINLFLIHYACCRLCNTWLLLFEDSSRSYHFAGASHWRKNIAAAITQDRMINDNLKRKIKNKTSHTCRLFLPTSLVQYISNWWKAFEHPPPSFFNIHSVIIFPNVSRSVNFQLIMQGYI